MNNPIDWTVLGLPGIDALCGRVARKVKDEGVPGRLANHDDLWQITRELAAGVRVLAPERGPTAMAARVRELHSRGELGRLHNELYGDLRNAVSTPVRHVGRHVSYEARYDEPADAEASWQPPTALPVIGAPEAEYGTSLVRRLLPGVWDGAFMWHSITETPPDRDMPRGTTNPATGGTLAAHLADVRSAWQRAPLSIEERRALVLVVGLDWTQQETAHNQRVDQSTVSRRVRAGLSKMVDFLSGASATGAGVELGRAVAA